MSCLWSTEKRHRTIQKRTTYFFTPVLYAQQCARRLCPSSSIHCILSNPAAATMHAMLLCMALGLVVAEDATDMLGWQPPKCASWCKFSDTNCNKDMCSGCDACLDMPPASPPAPGGGASSGSLAPGLCGAGCNQKYCGLTNSPLQCDGCKFCTAPNSAMCEGWCSKEHHCQDGRCGDCPHCTVSVTSQCPQWCANHHCRDDARCSKCAICAPPSPPGMAINPAAVAAAKAAAMQAQAEALQRQATAAAAQASVQTASATEQAAAGAAAGTPIPHAPIKEGTCNHWCQAHHCTTKDSRCSGCPECTGQPRPLEGRRPIICENWCRADRHHCKTDDRCAECSFCLDNPETTIWPPPPPPSPPPTMPPRPPPPPTPKPEVKKKPPVGSDTTSAADAKVSAAAQATANMKGTVLGAPTALTLKRNNCSSVLLGWKRPAAGEGGADEAVLDYELTVHAQAAGASAGASAGAGAGATYSIGGITSMDYVVEGLDSSTDYTVRVRARSVAGWGALGPELALRTNPPSRLLPPPEAPTREPSASVEEGDDMQCAQVELRLPMLRKGCARDTALALEYRLPGADAEWKAYEHPALLEGNLERLRVDLSREGVKAAGAAAYRLKAWRGKVASEPSEILEGLEGCAEGGPLRSSTTVLAALVIAASLLLLIVIALCRVTRTDYASGSFEADKHEPQKQHMTKLNTADDDDAADDEISVRYELVSGGNRPIAGMLPLAGIASTDELLEELAEFGCELQDDTILSVPTIEAYYEDRRGKTKQLGPRTPLREVIESGEITVVQTAAAPVPAPSASRPSRAAPSRVSVTVPPKRMSRAYP